MTAKEKIRIIAEDFALKQYGKSLLNLSNATQNSIWIGAIINYLDEINFKK
jgi:hypothetical protein